MTGRSAIRNPQSEIARLRPTHTPSVLWDEIVIDCFAGGGGASLGIELGLGPRGRAVDVAINHDPLAVAMHRVNHPRTAHYCADIWSAQPIEVTAGRPVGLAWFSPDCTFHSKARGGKPIRRPEEKRRDLAWVVIKWAREVRPRVIMLENVEEFAQWGPLVRAKGPRAKGLGPRGWTPCPRRRGKTFRRWKKQLTNLGYAVEHRELRACDYGTPTIRKRLFLIARCDGQPIAWPEVTHGDLSKPRSRVVSSREKANLGGVRHRGSNVGDVGESAEMGTLEQNWRRDGEVEPCVARQDSGDALRPNVRRSEAGNRRRSTCRIPGTRRHEERDSLLASVLKPFRTAAQCIDWSLPCPSIFLTADEARAYYHATGARIIRPLKAKTLQRIANGLKRYVIDAAEPFIVRANHGSHGFRGQSTRKPMCTLTSSRDAHGLVVPSVAPIVVQQNGEAPHQDMRGQRLDRPLSTIACSNRHKFVTAFLNKHRTGATGADLREPCPTITSGGNGNGREAGAAHTLGVTAAVLTKYHGSKNGESRCLPADAPVNTLDTQNRVGVVAACLAQVDHSKTTGRGKYVRSVREPVPTIATSNGHAGLVAAFLQTYYGNGVNASTPAAPQATLRCKESASLVTVNVHGIPYVITDIGMRMLSPRELFRCQCFPDSYIIDHVFDSSGARVTLSKAAQVRMCGNSVCPQVAAAIVKANVTEQSAVPAGEIA